MPATFRANSARIIITGGDNAIPATPTVLRLPATQVTLDLSEDGETANRLGNGVEPSREILSGVKNISSNIELQLNYHTAAFALGISVGREDSVESNEGDWSDGATVTAGQILKGTTPATDDLYCVSGGTTGAIAPDTSSLLDGETIDDNGVVWAVSKSRLKEVVSGINPCLSAIAIEYEFQDCDGNLMYMRTLGNSAASFATNFEKKTVPKVTVATNGSVYEDDLDPLIAYEKMMDIAGATEIVIDEGYNVRNSNLGMSIGASATYAIVTMSLNSDNAQGTIDPLNQDRFFTTGVRNVSGSLTGWFDEDMYNTMVKNLDSNLLISYDDGLGNYLSFTLPTVTFPLKSPTFEAGMQSKLDADYKAYGETGSIAASAFQYKVRSTQVLNS
jgi:hypothetical protein